MIAQDAMLKMIFLNVLSVSPENARIVKSTQAENEELKASILAHGLLENLVVTPAETDGAFLVVAGQRRLKALQEIHGKGEVLIPCTVIENGSMQEISLAENVVRAGLHPADQITAFTKLAADGLSSETIAARFGVTSRLVEQRLSLGNLAPAVLKAYRNEKISMETLKAFSVNGDQKIQEKTLKRFMDQGYGPSPWQIKSALVENHISAGFPTARFVGLKAYEAAGGVVLRDLFAHETDDGVYLADSVLLNELADKKLSAEAAKILNDGWSWTEAVVDFDYQARSRFGQIHPEKAEATDAEKVELESLEKRERKLADGVWNNAAERKYDKIEARRLKINDDIRSRDVFRPEDKEIAGCIATIDRTGNLEIITGVVRPEDMKKISPDSRETRAVDPEQQHSNTHADPAKAALKKQGISASLADDLRSIRTALVKAKLGHNYDASFDLLLFQLVRSVFNQDYMPDALDIRINETPDRPITRINDKDFTSWSPGEAMLEDVSYLSMDWLTIKNNGKSFAAMRSLPPSAKKALFAAAVARTVKGQLAFEYDACPELESTIESLKIDFAKLVRPTSEMFWSRMTKSKILAIAKTALGATWVKGYGKKPKKEIAAALQEIFSAKPDSKAKMEVGPDRIVKAKAWTIPGFSASAAPKKSRKAKDTK